MRSTAAPLLAAAAIAVLGVLVATSGAASSISVGDNYFVRPSGVPTVSAKAGARITFRFVGRRAHRVSVSSGPSRFTSPRRSSGSFKTPALRAGRYFIVCTIHGKFDQSMRLTVK